MNQNLAKRHIVTPRKKGTCLMEVCLDGNQCSPGPPVGLICESELNWPVYRQKEKSGPCGFAFLTLVCSDRFLVDCSRVVDVDRIRALTRGDHGSSTRRISPSTEVRHWNSSLSRLSVSLTSTGVGRCARHCSDASASLGQKFMAAKIH